MRYFYYPGCTLKTTAKSFDESIKKLANILDIDLIELSSWYCCGAIYTDVLDTPSLLLGSIRNLVETSKEDDKLVSACSACYNVLIRAQENYFKDFSLKERVDAYLEEPLKKKIKIVHFFEILEENLDKLSSLVKQEKEVKVTCYYGCLLTRPKGIALFSNDINPRRLENLFERLKIKAIDFSFKTRCCGSYLTYTNEEIVKDCVEKIVVSIDGEAQNNNLSLLTTCPLCQFNLERYQNKYKVFYFTDFLLSIIKGD